MGQAISGWDAKGGVLSKGLTTISLLKTHCYETIDQKNSTEPGRVTV